MTLFREWRAGFIMCCLMKSGWREVRLWSHWPAWFRAVASLVSSQNTERCWHPERPPWSGPLWKCLSSSLWWMSYRGYSDSISSQRQQRIWRGPGQR